jgi:hypothetical protein
MVCWWKGLKTPLDWQEGHCHAWGPKAKKEVIANDLE